MKKKAKEMAIKAESGEARRGAGLAAFLTPEAAKAAVTEGAGGKRKKAEEEVGEVKKKKKKSKE